MPINSTTSSTTENIMIKQKKLLNLKFNKGVSSVIDEDNKKHLEDINDKIINTEEEYSEQLQRLIDYKEKFGKTTKEFASLTKPMPVGWTTMSHATIYNILNGSTKFNAMQLQEFCRVMNIPVMNILEREGNTVRTEIVFEFNYEKGFCETIHFDKPKQAIYFKNVKYQSAGTRAILYRGTPENTWRKSSVSLFDINSKNLFRKKEGRDYLLFKHSLIKCGTDGKYYLGKMIEWFDDVNYEDKSLNEYRCKWQWFKGMKKEKNGMINQNWELRNVSKFTEIYPLDVWDITLRNDHIILDII